MATNILDLARGGFKALPIDKESTDALLAAGKVLESAIKRRLSRSGGPSAPGESPALLSGELYRSITSRVIRRRKSNRGDKVRVATNLPQAPALEFGYVGKGKAAHVRESEMGGYGAAGGTGQRQRVLKPRPFMRPALDEVKEQMTSALLTKMRARGVRELRNEAAERSARREHEGVA